MDYDTKHTIRSNAINSLIIINELVAANFYGGLEEEQYLEQLSRLVRLQKKTFDLLKE